jgi:hypothetical protein
MSHALTSSPQIRDKATTPEREQAPYDAERQFEFINRLHPRPQHDIRSSPCHWTCFVQQMIKKGTPVSLPRRQRRWNIHLEFFYPDGLAYRLSV